MNDFNKTATVAHAHEGADLSTRAAALPVILTSALLGAFLVFGVGFAHSDVIHNAAHDTRHAVGFPCH